MIQPGVYDIKLQRRADYSVLLQFKDANKTPINLTGWTAAAQIWDQGRNNKYADFSIEYTNRQQGQVHLRLARSITTTLPNEAVYDVLLVNPSDEREYYIKGTILTSEGYTTLS